MVKPPASVAEALARMVDSEYVRVDDPATAELLETLSRCDLMIGAVVDYITSSEADGGWWHYAYGVVSQDAAEADARRRLAETFGRVYEHDLVHKAEQANNGAKAATERMDEARNKQRAAEDALRESLQRERKLQLVLADVLREARRDREGTAQNIIHAITEHASVYDAVAARMAEQEAQWARGGA